MGLAMGMDQVLPLLNMLLRPYVATGRSILA